MMYCETNPNYSDFLLISARLKSQISVTGFLVDLVLFWLTKAEEVTFTATVQNTLALFHHRRRVYILILRFASFQKFVCCWFQASHCVSLICLLQCWLVIVPHKVWVDFTGWKTGKTLPWPNIQVALRHSLLSCWLPTSVCIVFTQRPNLAECNRAKVMHSLVKANHSLIR